MTNELQKAWDYFEIEMSRNNTSLEILSTIKTAFFTGAAVALSALGYPCKVEECEKYHDLVDTCAENLNQKQNGEQ